MDMLDLHESVSAATHGVALLAALPAIAVLVARGRSDLARTLALLSYAFGLVLCFAASTACHALVAAGMGSRTVVMIDHVAIYFLIAGTYTPIVATLLPPRQRRPTLVVVWLAAALGVGLNLRMGPLPAWLATSFYLAMGWGGLWCYAGLRPALTHRQLAWIPLGGVFYTVGAIFHVVRRPVVWPGVFEAHELFHILVIAGAAAHFAFVLRYVAMASHERRDSLRPALDTADRPRHAFQRRPKPLAVGVRSRRVEA